MAVGGVILELDYVKSFSKRDSAIEVYHGHDISSELPLGFEGNSMGGGVHIYNSIILREK